jgi:hypothetical protein
MGYYNNTTYDKFLNKHSLADTSTAEETNLSSTSVRCKEIDNLDTRHQDFSTCRLFNEFWWICVDR